MDAVASPSKSGTSNGRRFTALTLAHLALSAALLWCVRSAGVDDDGQVSTPLLNVVLAAAFQAVTLPVFLARALLAPLLRSPSLDALLLAANALVHAQVLLAIHRVWSRRKGAGT